MNDKDFPLGISPFHFSDLYKVEKLKELHSAFWRFVQESSFGLPQQFSEMGRPSIPKPRESEILMETARCLGDFVSKLFHITSYTAQLKANTLELFPIFRFKKEFLQLRVFKRFEDPPIPEADFLELDDRIKKFIGNDSQSLGSARHDEELVVSRVVTFLLDCAKNLKSGGLEGSAEQRLVNLCSPIVGGTLPEKVEDALFSFEHWCVQRYVAPSRRNLMQDWVSYVRPNKLDFLNLVQHARPDPDLSEKMIGNHHRLRDGFKLTDPRMNTKQVIREIDYCILCHRREKDSCAMGFPEKTGGYKKNPLGIALKGCPLDERISEMHQLRKQGNAIASLAMMMLDNPMCPGTGHRICNDCMKGCIFQKQDPVNIPQAETGILTDVLNLPYGFEIYSLLTRFNPLLRSRPYALPYNGKDVLVVGLGPAGYTLTHFLANSGFGVVGIDGLKLEPIDNLLTGSGRPFPKPIQNFSELVKNLDDRILIGFGGVSEYGITVRWDKNFLTVIYLTLLRRANVRFYGGIRFGGTLTLDDAWGLGFEHVAIATGAGKPTIIKMKNNLIRGIRKASDFLMALQLTGAFKKSSLANLQVKLPAIVIGGGLTAIDAATEILAYYQVQVEKILQRFEKLRAQFGEPTVWQMCDEEETETLKTFLEHAASIREERRNAEQEKRKPDVLSLCRRWGGVSIVYRKRMIDSPAYRLNHEEVIKALEEGIYFIENLSPVEATPDRFGAVSALVFERPDRSKVTLDAKTVCVAAGTSPNIIYEKEHPGTFHLDERKTFFKKYKTAQKEGQWELSEAGSQEKDAFFLSYHKEGKFVTFYGDNHPDYAGSVVKAMASAKNGFPQIAKLFEKDIALAEKEAQSFSRFENLTRTLDEALVPRIVRVARLTPTIVEVIVKAKYAAQKFEPGQFYRLQNYETFAHNIDGNRLTMEGIALTGAWVDKQTQQLGLIVLEMGVSSRLCAILKPGEPVVLMGPTGTPSEIPRNETVLLAGGGLGNAVLLSIAKALRSNESRVVYFAGYRKREDLFKQTQIEEVTDQVVWSVDGGEPIEVRRPQDQTFVGNIVQAILSYGTGKIQSPPMFTLGKIDRLIAIGSDRMMAAVCEARHGVLKPILKPDHVAIASINSPMQCMMKEVCAQCLQKHVDPVTKKEAEVVFSCFNQDQLMDRVDFKNLNDRLKSNSLPEKITNRYLDMLFAKGKMERI